MQQSSIKNKSQPTSAGWKKFILVVGLGTSLMGCGDYGPDMKIELAKQLSTAWQVESLHIDEWEIASREPRQWHYRFTAKAVPAENLYKKIGTLNDTVVLQPAVKKGVVTDLEGTASAGLSGGQWHSQFAFDRTGAFLDSAPATAYGDNIFIVGSPKRDAFLAEAETALQQSETQLRNEQAVLSEKINEWKSVDATLRESVIQANNNLKVEQQQLRQEQMSIDSTVEREVRAANMALQAKSEEDRKNASKAYDVRRAAITQAYHAKKQALQQQYRELSATGRPHAEHSKRYAQLNEEDSGIERQFRDQREQAHAAYLGHLKDIQQEFEARRALLRDDITQTVTARIDQSSAALHEKSQQQEVLLLASGNQLAQQRHAIVRLSAEVTNCQTDLARQRALLEQLKALSN